MTLTPKFYSLFGVLIALLVVFVFRLNILTGSLSVEVSQLAAISLAPGLGEGGAMADMTDTAVPTNPDSADNFYTANNPDNSINCHTAGSNVAGSMQHEGPLCSAYYDPAHTGNEVFYAKYYYVGTAKMTSQQIVNAGLAGARSLTAQFCNVAGAGPFRETKTKVKTPDDLKQADMSNASFVKVYGTCDRL